MEPLYAVSPRRVPCAALLAMGVRVGDEVMGFIFRCQTSRGELVGAPGVPTSSPCNVIPKGSDSRGTLIRRLSPARAMRPMRVPYKRSRQADWIITLFLCNIVNTTEKKNAGCASCATTERYIMRTIDPYPSFYPLRKRESGHAHVTPCKIFQHYLTAQLLYYTYTNFVRGAKRNDVLHIGNRALIGSRSFADGRPRRKYVSKSRSFSN